MNLKVILSSMFLLSALSCKRQSAQEQFVHQYLLSPYDTIVLISSFSCGGCIVGFIANVHNAPNKVFVYDSSNHNAFATSLKNHNTVHVTQSAMDSVFGKFGNIIVLKKINGGYIKEELADMR